MIDALSKRLPVRSGRGPWQGSGGGSWAVSWAVSWGIALGLSAVLLLAGCTGDDSGDASPDETPLPSSKLDVDQPWVRPAAPGGNSALYMTILNGTSTPDTLLDVTAPVIDSIQIHQTVDSAGTMRMQPLGETLPIPPKTRVTLEPGAKHVMLMNLSQPLTDGESIVLDLDFAQKGLLRVRAPIRVEAPPSGRES